MAYPKRDEFEKKTFIAKVLLLLKSKGMEKEYQRLETIADLDKRYESAKYYNRNLGQTYEDTMYTTSSQNDMDIASSSTEEVNADVTSLEVPHKHFGCNAPKRQCKGEKSPSFNQITRERRNMLMEKHVEVLDWIQCIDDGIVKNNIDEARRMVNVLNDYADKLDALIKEKFYGRAANLWRQFIEITASMQDDEVEKIKKEVEALAPQYAR